MDASKRTADKNQQMIYANILMQQQQLDLGILGKITYRGGSSGGGADYTNTIGAITQGIITTPLAQQQLILNQFTRSLPVPPVPPVPPVILVFYGYSVTTYVGGLISPLYITLNSINNIYVTSFHLISKIGTNGEVTVVAGQTTPGITDNAFGTNATFNVPNGIAIDSTGNLYVADTLYHRIRKIDTNGYVTTLAGQTTSGITDNAFGTNAKFNRPFGIVIDSTGNLYVADTVNNRIRKIVTSTGYVTTVAGDAQFSNPQSITIDSAGNLYVADTNNQLIRKIASNGEVTTIAGQLGIPGSTDDIGTNATFYNPQGITIDSSGNLYVADSLNRTIRKIEYTTKSVTTIAGKVGISASTDAVGTNATFTNPIGIVIDSTGNIYVVDRGNGTIRKLTPLYEESR